MEGVDHLITTERECQLLLGNADPEQEPSLESMMIAANRLHDVGIRNVVITMRSRGVVLYTEEGVNGVHWDFFEWPEGYDWASYDFVFTAAYAVAVARNGNEFRTATAVGEAVDTAVFALEQRSFQLTRLHHLPYMNLRFDHLRELELKELIRRDRGAANAVAEI